MEPLTPQEAQKRFRDILENGSVRFTGHARREMVKDDMCELDCRNLIRGVLSRPAEWENEAWRYRIETQRMCVVCELSEVDGQEELVIITAWRFKP